MKKRRAKADSGLRNIIRSHTPFVHWTPIESAVTESGIPDLHGCYKGMDAWIETKWTGGWAVEMRIFQISWLARRARSGGRGFIAVRRKCDAGVHRKAADEVWLYRGERAEELGRLGLAGLKPLVRFEGGPAGWDWDRFIRLIFL